MIKSNCSIQYVNHRMFNSTAYIRSDGEMIFVYDDRMKYLFGSLAETDYRVLP